MQNFIKAITEFRYQNRNSKNLQREIENGQMLNLSKPRNYFTPNKVNSK